MYRDAIAYGQHALALSPSEASILNNLALAHAMLGELGLQAKYEEAKLAAAHDLPADKAAATVEYARSLVALEPKPLVTGALDNGAKPQTTGAAKVAANDDKDETPAKTAKTAKRNGQQKKDAKDKDSPADDGSADAASGWTTKVAAVKPVR
jgi:hypothetical protein